MSSRFSPWLPFHFPSAGRIARPVILAAFLVAAFPLYGWSATLLESSRTVQVSAFVNIVSGTTEDDAVGSQSESAGNFLDVAVGGAGIGDLAVANGEATQDSVIELGTGGGIVLDAVGAAGVLFQVQDGETTSRAQGLADSRVSMTFAVAQASDYSLLSFLSADLEELDVRTGRFYEGAAEAEVVATLRLSGLLSGVVVEREVRDSTDGVAPVLDDFFVEGRLAPDTYLLEIEAISDLRGTAWADGFGVAGYSALLTVVPEPGTAMLLGLGLIGLASSERRQAA